MKAHLTLLFASFTASATAQCSAHLLLDKRIHTDAYVVGNKAKPQLALTIESDSVHLITADGRTIGASLDSSAMAVLRTAVFGEVRIFTNSTMTTHRIDSRSSSQLNKLPSCAALPKLDNMPLQSPLVDLSPGQHLIQAGRLQNAGIALAVVGGGIAALLATQGESDASLAIGGVVLLGTLSLQIGANGHLIKAGRKLGR